jgi:hypothetical protein
MRYREFKIVEGYTEVTKKFSQEADPLQVKQIIDTYRDLVNRNQVQGNERNIDWWGKQGWEKFARFVQAKSQQSSQTQTKKRSKAGDSHTIEENNTWLIVVPLDKEASCFHGKDSDWCTTKPNRDYFERYFRDDGITLIYFLQKQTGAKWAMAVAQRGSVEYFDKNDRSLTKKQFDAQTGLDSSRYETEATTYDSPTQKRVDTAQSNMRYDKRELEKMVDDFVYQPRSSRDPQIETLLLKVKNGHSLRHYIHHLTNSVGKINFDQNMQDLIVSISPHLLKYVGNVSERSARSAVKKDAELIEYIVNPSTAVVKLAVETDPFIIQKIKDPSPEVIDYAIGISPFAIQALKGKVTTDQLITATNAFLNMPEEDGGPNTRDGVPTVFDVTRWLSNSNFSNRNMNITDYKFYRWLVDNYKFGANAIAAFFMTSGKIYNAKIMQEILEIKPSFADAVKDLPVVDNQKNQES